MMFLIPCSHKNCIGQSTALIVLAYPLERQVTRDTARIQVMQDAMNVYLKILDQALIVDTPAVALEWSHNGNNRTGEHELGHPGGSPLNAPGRWSFSKCGVHNKS